MYQILQGDVMEMLRTLADESVQCCVTSPPYWGLRDYGIAASVWPEYRAQGTGNREQSKNPGFVADNCELTTVNCERSEHK